ncbi:MULTISPECIES: hypothetical protein [Photorhabdus]|nr:MULTISPECIES: hypothetical protein [Photorhabdus]
MSDLFVGILRRKTYFFPIKLGFCLKGVSTCIAVFDLLAVSVVC